LGADPRARCACFYGFIDFRALEMFILLDFSSNGVVIGLLFLFSQRMWCAWLYDANFEFEFLWSRCRVVMSTFCLPCAHVLVACIVARFVIAMWFG
jgi:hypothetical protein